MSSKIHPWNQDRWQVLTARPEQLSHGLLFAGPQGLGKRAFVHEFTSWLLCLNPTTGKQACGQCSSCRHWEAGSHPDLHVLQSEADTQKFETDPLSRHALRYQDERAGQRKHLSTIIAVDQVRRLISNMQTRAHSAPNKVVVLLPAEAMNQNAANSLLKLLEEPPEDSYLLLLSHQPSSLPATIRSRCSVTEFRIPPRDRALAWLEAQWVGKSNGKNNNELVLGLAAGAPLRAQAYTEDGFLEHRKQMITDVTGLTQGTADPVSCAKRWQDFGVNNVLAWLQGWVIDLIRLAMSNRPPLLNNPDVGTQLKDSARTFNLKRLYSFLQVVSEARAQSGAVLDDGLLLEDVLIRWTRMGKK
ncbi:MAG TPA: DNA polymerase III subunit delta' [Acidiferrobacteraceae bacterium]|nr:DNA polymerase III subunit delta' [Acidiferrobacteraceae bacterium]